MLCLHQQQNKNIFTPKCYGSETAVYQMKNPAREIKQQVIWYKRFILWETASFKGTATLSQSYLNHQGLNVMSIFLAKLREWKMQLECCQDSVIF